jgi:manganese/zinc/iron transport system permease protein
MLEVFTNPTLRTIALGTACLGVCAAILGVFAVLRRQSMGADVASHAALPGVAVGFWFFGDHPEALIASGAISAWLAIVIANQLPKLCHVQVESALAAVLVFFFGLGMVLMRMLTEGRPDTGSLGLEKYLFGQAATLLERDAWQMMGLMACVIVCVAVFWPMLTLTTFDRDAACVRGVPVGLVDFGYTMLFVLVIALGLPAVGAVLMSALVVAPAIAARFWTRRLLPRPCLVVRASG